MMMQGNAIADFEFFDSCADFRDDASGFMTEDARRRDGCILDFFDVGRADSASGDFYEQFIGFDLWNGDGFDAKVVGAAIDDCEHLFWDLKHGGDLTQRRKGAKTQSKF